MKLYYHLIGSKLVSIKWIKFKCLTIMFFKIQSQLLELISIATLEYNNFHSVIYSEGISCTYICYFPFYEII